MDAILFPSDIGSKSPENWSSDTCLWYVKMEWSLRVMYPDLGILSDNERYAITLFMTFHNNPTDENRANLFDMLTIILQDYQTIVESDDSDINRFMVCHAKWMLEYSFETAIQSPFLE